MPTALFIEDNSDIRENVTELLELEGFEVISAPEAETGLALARARKPDVILCDIMMPVTDGYEVLRRLKEDPDTCLIPFIFVTASTEKIEVKKGLSLGANAYVKKPFETQELFAAIELCLMVP